MVRIFGRTTLLLLAVGVTLLTSRTAAATEQIVFSGTGAFAGVTPFGFWIWCESQDSGNPYRGQCNGAMYFYALGITKHVAGSITEIAEGSIFQIDVVSTVDDSVACSLTNSSPPVKGPHNTVTVNCTAPSAVDSITGTSNNAVIALGP